MFQGRESLMGSGFCCEPGTDLRLPRKSSQTPLDGRQEEGINGLTPSLAVPSALCKCFGQFG